MLKIFNTFSRKKEKFQPINTEKICIYVCGVTIYDLCHIGHGRTFVVFDVVIRYLRYIGYSLKYVRNITDVDDKIIKCATEKGETCDQLTTRMVKQMHIDFDSLQMERPNKEPKVTHNIAEILAMIHRINKRDHSYVTNNGDVMFSIKKNSDYGILSRQNIYKLKNSNRVQEIKLNSIDFVLWKKIKPGEPSWESPWGPGRPGWHIECSAINCKNLGTHFDIHGGGADLIFPHHENEMAQSSCANEGPYVNYWMHSGMVMINKEKISKSIKNCLTIRDVLSYYDHETVRYFLMSKHYRSPIDYNEDNLKKSSYSLKKLYTIIMNTDFHVVPSGCNIYKERFCDAMNDDFNTPEAYSILFDIAREVNRHKNCKNMVSASNLASELRSLSKIFGFLQQNPEIFLKRCEKYKEYSEIEEIQELITCRKEARDIFDWTLADEIRAFLKKNGIILEDNLKGRTVWRKIHT